MPTQVGLLPQGVRLLRSSGLPQPAAESFAFPQSPCPPEHSFMEEDVGTPKVSGGFGVYWSGRQCRW